MSYLFVILDPRNIDAATEANEKAFGLGPMFGIEVTVPALAARCVANIDPQHTGGNAELTAIEVAMSEELPPEGSVFATVRADLDSVGAMAVLVLRQEGTELFPAMERITQVAESDKFARGPYHGPFGLPTESEPWPEAGASASESQPLAAIAAAVADFKVSLTDRVQVMKTWLVTGAEPESYRAQVEKERCELVTALERGDIETRTEIDGKVAVVISTHRAATSVGYALAPVVMALNPSFRVAGGEPHTKFTICQYQPGFVNLGKVKEDLAVLENGWGGSPNIIGSPQGTPSTLSMETVIEVVARHLN